MSENAVTLRQMMNALEAAAETEERAGMVGPFEQLSDQLGGATIDADNATVQASEAARLFDSDQLATWRNIVETLASGTQGAGDNYHREDIQTARDALQQLSLLYQQARESADAVLHAVDATVIAL